MAVEGVEPIEGYPSNVPDFRSPVPKMTKIQARFVHHFFDCEFDPEQAIILAGYMGDTPRNAAEKVMSSPVVREAILSRLSQIKKTQEISADAVMRELWDNATDKEETGSPNSRVAALNFLAKILGLYESGNKAKRSVVAVNMDLSGLSSPEAIANAKNSE